jgi:hypothetical protein
MKRTKDWGHWGGWFYDETWRANIEIIWPVTGAMVSKYLKARHGADYSVSNEFAAKCVELLDAQGAETNVICLQWWPAKPGPKHYAMLAHEVFHAADHVLSKRGVELGRYTTEPYAYFIESITRRCLTLLDTRRKLE